MKNKLTAKLFVLVCSATIAACGCHDDCVVRELQLSIVDTDGKDVFAEPDPLYNYDDVKITWIESNGSPGEMVLYYHGSSFVSFQLFPNVNEYVVQYSTTEADRITIGPTILDSDCCGKVIVDFEMYLNDVLQCTSCKDHVVTLVK